MDYKPRPILSNPTLNKTYKKKRIFWLNSDFNDGFTLINNKIIDVSFNVPPFQLYNNNNMRVIAYIRNDANVSPIIIKLKEPYCDSRLITNTDKEGNPVIYVNHSGVEGMTSISPNFLLIPQQIPRFVFRLDDNFNQLNSDYYFSSVTNGSFIQVAGGSPDDKYLLFNSSGSFTLNANLNVDVLVVGGGGGGGSGHGAGGGAGALIYETNKTLSSGSYSITIGTGGTSASRGVIPTTGGDSSISFNGTNIYLAKGGGGGAPAGGTIGTNGGSGGGGNGNTIGTAVSTNIPSGTYGNNGGLGTDGGTGDAWAGGGGGGAGAVGSSSTKSSNNLSGFAGNGGIGSQISITGSSIFYAGGGGGGCINRNSSTPGTGGNGGGGNGASGAGQGSNGIANTGGGGGGGGFNRDNNTDSIGGTGGSGIVIIKFREIRQEGITPVNNKPPSFMLGLELEDIDMKKDNIVSIYR